MYPGFQGIKDILYTNKRVYTVPGNQGTHDNLNHGSENSSTLLYSHEISLDPTNLCTSSIILGQFVLEFFVDFFIA